MIDDVSTRIKDILKRQQNTPKTPLLSKIRSPSRENSVSSNRSYHNHHSANNISQSSHKNMYPPPRRPDTSKRIPTKSKQKELEYQKGNRQLSSELIRDQNRIREGTKSNGFQTMRRDSQEESDQEIMKEQTDNQLRYGKPELFETFNLNSNRMSTHNKTEQHFLQEMKGGHKNIEQKDIRDIVKEMIEDNNKSYVDVALDAYEENIYESLLAKIRDILPIFIKSQIQMKNSQEPKEQISKIESIFYETPLVAPKRQSIDSSVMADDLIFTPKIKKYTESMESLNTEKQMHEQIMLQKQILFKYHSLMVSLSSKITGLQRQMASLRSYAISSKQGSRGSRLESQRTKQLENIKTTTLHLQKKIEYLSKDIDNIGKQLNQHKPNKIDNSDKEMIEKIVESIAPKAKCRCQSVIDQILKSQKHMLAELKYLKHFSKAKEAGRQNKAINKQRHEDQQTKIFNKLSLFCKNHD